MSNSEVIQDTPTGVSAGLPASTEARTRTIAELVQEAGHLKNSTRVLVDGTNELHSDSSRLHDATLHQLLRTLTADQARAPLGQLLERLSAEGLAWRDIARLVGVSVPAVRKWRVGEHATGENRRRVAEIVAFFDVVREHYLIDDTASWLEVPLIQGVPVTGLDLLAAGRFDLLFQWAGDLRADPEEILDDYHADWRSDFASDVEVFTAPDGQNGLRLRSE